MEKLNKNPIDQYFKENLEAAELQFQDQDWKKMEELLHPKSKRQGVAVWYYVSGIAAILLAFLSIWLFKADVLVEQKAKNKSIPETKKDNTETIAPNQSLTNGNPSDTALDTNKQAGKSESLVVATNSSKKSETGNSDAFFINKNRGIQELHIIQDDSSKNPPENDFAISKIQINMLSNNGSIYTPTILNTVPINTNLDSSSNKDRSKIKIDENSKWSFALAFSPDLNTVSNLKNSSFGTGFGMGISYQLSKRITLNTGLAYAKKIYSANAVSYQSQEMPFNSSINSIAADCRVLDIPLNMNYIFSRQKKQTLFVSAGISSYFMLNEKYTFNVAAGTPGFYTPNGSYTPGFYTPGSTEIRDISYTIKNKNEHILGVLNLAAGIQKPISKQTSIIVQPYMKIPLQGVGQGKVDLKSFGFSFQVNYNLKKK